MKKLRIIILALLCLAVIAPFAACGGGEPDAAPVNPAEGGDNGGEDGDPAEEVSPHAPTHLPDTDMGGKIFNFLTSGTERADSRIKDIFLEEQTGDPIDDAAFHRKVKIEQQYNVRIRQIFSIDDTVQVYRTAILAGDDTYDAAFTDCGSFTTLLTGNFLVDFKEIDFIEMEKPYWNKSFFDTMSIMGTNFGADGGVSSRSLECVWIMAFNKAMIRDNGLDSPFELVRNGEWTYFKMHEMARSAARDVNGSGFMSIHEDIWGLNYTGDTIMGIINSSGVRVAVLNDEGIPELTVGLESNVEKLLRIYADMKNHEYSIDTLFNTQVEVGEVGDVTVFAEERALFLACATHNIRAHTGADTANVFGLRSLDVDFGIIPYPKWDETVPHYTPFTSGGFHPVLTVPQTNHDLANTGIILEAMAYEGWKNIYPAFYENLLKTKTARDDESEEMIDFIFGNLQYDVGNMLNIGGIVGVFGYEAAMNPRFNVSSTIERNSNRWQRAINDLVEEISKR